MVRITKGCYCCRRVECVAGGGQRVRDPQRHEADARHEGPVPRHQRGGQRRRHHRHRRGL